MVVACFVTERKGHSAKKTASTLYNQSCAPGGQYERALLLDQLNRQVESMCEEGACNTEPVLLQCRRVPASLHLALTQDFVAFRGVAFDCMFVSHVAKTGVSGIRRGDHLLLTFTGGDSAVGILQLCLRVDRPRGDAQFYVLLRRLRRVRGAH